MLYSYDHVDIYIYIIYTFKYIYMYKCMYVHLIMVKWGTLRVKEIHFGTHRATWSGIKKQQLVIPTTGISNWNTTKQSRTIPKVHMQIFFFQEVVETNILPPSRDPFCTKLQSWFCWDFRCLHLHIGVAFMLEVLRITRSTVTWMKPFGKYPKIGVFSPPNHPF